MQYWEENKSTSAYLYCGTMKICRQVGREGGGGRGRDGEGGTTGGMEGGRQGGREREMKGEREAGRDSEKKQLKF